VTVQLISRPGVDENKILGNLFALRLLSAILFLGLAPLTVLLFPYNAAIKLGVAITALSFLFIALNQILVGLFQKNLRMDKVALAEVISRLVLVSGTILAVKLNFGLVGILIVTVLANAVSFLLHYIFSLSFARLRLQFDFAYWLKIMARAWPLAITIVLNLIYLKTDILLLSILKRPSELGLMAEVGIYGAAYKVIDVLITLPFMLAGVILPLLTIRWATKDKNGFNKVVQKSFDVMVILAIPLAIGAQPIATQIMTLVAGKNFALAGPILQILILAAAAVYFGSIFAHAIIAMDKQKKIISAYLFTALTSLIGYFIFIPRFSYFGAAWVTIYSEVAIATASIYLVWKYARFLPNLKIFFKALAASIIMILIIYLLKIFNIQNLFLVITIAIMVYFLALFSFRGFTKQDIADLLNK
jgi:O-antigen/teichoic acid export membrane protein